MLDYLSIDSKLIKNPNELSLKKNLLIPGVGSFEEGCKLLDKNNWREPIMNIVDNNNTIIGICLGMQLLCEKSDEGFGSGLGIFKTTLTKFSGNLKVPHMGWNEIYLNKSYKGEKIPLPERYYFVHSYKVDSSFEYSLYHTNYGEKFTSIIKKNKIWGLQFHPEKSHKYGMNLFRRILQ